MSGGAVNETVICAWPAVATGWGIVAGAPTTTTAEGSDLNPVPVRFVADTTHTYAAPFVNPATTIGATAPVFDALPAIAVVEVVG